MLSCVAGVIDRGGGMRVVITSGCLGCHVGPGERIHVVPGLMVREPVPLEDVPELVRRVLDFIASRAR